MMLSPLMKPIYMRSLAFRLSSISPPISTPGKAEMDARFNKMLAKRTKKSASVRPAAGASSSSGAPRATEAAKGPTVPKRGAAQDAASVRNPAPLRQVRPAREGSSRQVVVPVQSDESSERESTQLRGRKRSRARNDPQSAVDSIPQIGGSASSPPPGTEIVDQYEAFALRDRMRQQGEDWRPEALPGQAPLVPDWRIYPTSSILGTGGAKVASEMARLSMLPGDKAKLITMPFTRLEDTIHRALAEASLAAHSLSLNLSYLNHENAEVRKSYENASAEIEEARNLRTEAQAVVQEQEQLRRQLAELKEAYNERNVEIEALKQDLAASKTELEASKAEAAQNYEVGHTDGRDAFLGSAEYKRTIEEARFNGARDFRHSTVFQMLALEPAADYLFDGFARAVDYMVKEGFTVPGFDPAAFEKYVTEPSLRPSIASSSVEYRVFPEFQTLGPVDSDEEDNRAAVPEDNNTSAPAAAEN